jgi:hypothetical protein
LALIHVDVNTIICRSNYKYLLVNITLEEHWLQYKGLIKLDDSLDLLSFIVELEDKLWLCKDDCIWIFTIFGLLEMIFHAYFVEDWQVFNYDSLVLLERVVLVGRFSFDFLKDEKLVLFLLVHDQVLATDDG